MKLLDVPVRRYKAYGGWAAEKAGRLELNGRLLRRAALSTAIELEGLLLLVEGKTLLWQRSAPLPPTTHAWTPSGSRNCTAVRSSSARPCAPCT